MLGVTKTMFLMPDKNKTENDVLVKLTNLKQTGGLLRFVSQATKSGFVPIKVLQGVLDVFFFAREATS